MAAKKKNLPKTPPEKAAKTPKAEKTPAAPSTVAGAQAQPPKPPWTPT